MRFPYKDHKSEAARQVGGLWNEVDKVPGKSLQALDTETESVSAVSAVKCPGDGIWVKQNIWDTFPISPRTMQ